MKKLLLFILVSIFIISCTKNEEPTPISSLLEEGEIALGYFPETEVPYILGLSNGIVVTSIDRDLDAKTESVVVSQNEKGMTIDYNPENNLPLSISTNTAESYNFFYNDDFSEVTVYYVKEDGSTGYEKSELKDIAIPSKLNGKFNKNSDPTAGELVSFLLTPLLTTVGVISCVGTFAAIFSTSGAAALLGAGAVATFTCGLAANGFVGLYNTYGSNDSDVAPNTVQAISIGGAGSDLLNCASPNTAQCAFGILQLSSIIIDMINEIIERNKVNLENELLRYEWEPEWLIDGLTTQSEFYACNDESLIESSYEPCLFSNYNRYHFVDNGRVVAFFYLAFVNMGAWELKGDLLTFTTVVNWANNSKRINRCFLKYNYKTQAFEGHDVYAFEVRCPGTYGGHQACLGNVRFVKGKLR